MSYILDALKKSDKERQQDEIPDFQTDHTVPITRGQRRKHSSFSWRLSGILILPILCVAFFFWWKFPAKQSILSPVQSVQNPPSPQAPDPQVRPVKQAVPVVAVTVEDVENVKDIEVVEVFEDDEDTAIIEETQFTQKEPPLLNELPVSVRAGIPELSFAGHVYSDFAEKRLIIINNRIVREGDFITDGLFLEQIDLDGVTLRYKETVFRVELF